MRPVRSGNRASSVQTNDGAVSDIVSLADLELQPLDFVFLIGKKVEATGFSELESRVNRMSVPSINGIRMVRCLMLTGASALGLFEVELACA